MKGIGIHGFGRIGLLITIFVIGVFLTGCGSKTGRSHHPSSKAVISFFNAWINRDWDSMKALLLHDNSRELAGLIDRLKSSVVRCKSIRLLDLQFGEKGTARAEVETEVTDLASVSGACAVMCVARLILREKVDINNELVEFQNLRKFFSPRRCGFESFTKRRELVYIAKQGDLWRVDIRKGTIPILKYAAIGGTLGESSEEAIEAIMSQPRVDPDTGGVGFPGPPSVEVELANLSIGLAFETTAMGEALGMSERQIDLAFKTGEAKSKQLSREDIVHILKELQGSSR